MLLHEKLKNYRLLLASQSPRRRELIAACGLPFELAPHYECEEVYPDTIPLIGVAEYLSYLKSEAYPNQLLDNDILLTADTVVLVGGTWDFGKEKTSFSGGEILGKPRDRDHALEMLGKLSGSTHQVVTGVTLRSCEHTEHFSVMTSVTLRALLDEEITYYVDTFRPYDKAGSYGIQEWIGYAAIEHIDGSFYNVMGLPIQKVYVELTKFIK